MKNKELKVLWKLAKRFLIAGFVVWILETIAFLIYEGWHFKATHPIEIFFDDVVSKMWNFSLCLTVVIYCYYLINLNKK